ncbi:MAG: fructosamine kinase family protein [Anaerolineae bacterium]|nr:fructosamine kinase family protein [Anaerolineae bacterium]
MTTISPFLQDIVTGQLKSAILKTTPVSGGDISQAVRLVLADGRSVLLKWHNRAVTGMFSAERWGLERLRAAESPLRIPAVWAQAEATDTTPAFIALEWLGQAAKTPTAGERLGQGLAQLHRATAELYGLEHDNFIGANPQPNRQTNQWLEFFREQRLGFQIELAGWQGYLSAIGTSRLERLLARLGDWLPAKPPASLLHGDLWGGNWLVTETGEPALIDPAVYYGHREADLAFTELFGGFPPAFYEAYQAVWPLDPSYGERKEIYNLYHLLNHLNLFGGSYLASVESVAARFGR